jgi:hypothetical protein
MPGVVSSLPPLAADTFEMAKTDDNFHIECLTGFVRGGYCFDFFDFLISKIGQRGKGALSDSHSRCP